MAKYSKGAQKAVKSAMKRMEKGTLKSGNSNKKVTNPKQAIAIGLSEAREKGAIVPIKKDKPKKAVPKKTVAKKTTTKTTKTSKPPLKTAVKKTAPKKKAIKKEIAEDKKLSIKEASLNSPVIDTLLKNESPIGEQSRVIFQQVEDPMMKVDKNLLKRITTKRDPQHNMQLSQSKSSIKPSGKKPLFNR